MSGMLTFAFPDPNGPTGGNDILFGSPNNEGVIRGQSGNDSIFGLEGDDLLVGGDGDDRLFGDQGRDVILGNEGDDFLSGDSGDDFLIGGRGADILWGGSGADYFIFRSQDDGVDRIFDFEFGVDKIVVPDFVASVGNEGQPPPGARLEITISGQPVDMLGGNLPLQGAERIPYQDPNFEDLYITYASFTSQGKAVLVGVSPNVYLTALFNPEALFIHVSDLPPDVQLDLLLFA